MVRLQPLIGAVLGERPDAKREQADFNSRRERPRRLPQPAVYFDLRNLSVTPEDRALNYAATNAFQARQVVEAATVQGLDLERITVHKSPICEPNSDCYDVEVTFFNPDNTNVAGRVFRFTVDVSTIPVTRRRAPMDPPGVTARIQVNCVASPALQPYGMLKRKR